MPSQLQPSPEHLLRLPITPPVTESDPESEQILQFASHVLSTEATALSHLSRLYATDPVARDGFVRAVDGITGSLSRGGKLVVIGVGKSGKIGEKLVATMISLGLLTVFMHPVEALHGDLGILRPNDIALLITYSGNTPELQMLLPHMPSTLPLIILTSHTSYHTMKLASARNNCILLPAPIPEPEEMTFGLPAPTTSTTVAMALGDAIALTVARAMHGEQVGGSREVFKRNHPGGAIGLNIGKVSLKMVDLAVPLAEIPLIHEEDDNEDSRPCTPSSDSDDSTMSWGDGSSSRSSVRVLDCLVMAVRSPKGWLRTARNEVIPPRCLQRIRDPNTRLRGSDGADILVPMDMWLRVPGDASIEETRKWILATAAEAEQEAVGGRETGMIQTTEAPVVGVVVGGKIIGVIEIEELLGAGRGLASVAV